LTPSDLAQLIAGLAERGELAPVMAGNSSGPASAETGERATAAA